MRIVLTVLILCLLLSNTSFTQEADTIYYNKAWRICEKPFAGYYRVGQVMIDSYWYYTGDVKDYDISGQLQMEGHYDSLGYKNGLFVFYHPNGNIAARGHFKNNLQFSLWDYYYENGNHRASIYFTGEDFTFLKYSDKEGNVLLKEGTGSFEWYINESSSGHLNKLQGSFDQGKRTDDWKYYIGTGENERLIAREKYENGVYKRGTGFTYSGGTRMKNQVPIRFTPYKFEATESFLADGYFNAFRDAGQLKDFLLKKQAPVFIDTASSFDGSMGFILKKLYGFKSGFNFQSNDYNGEIKFYLDHTGILKDISIEGNLPEKEKDVLLLILQKFQHIQQPGTKEIGIDSWHTIYFFTYDLKEVLPRYLRQYGWKDFFFSPYPREKFKDHVKFKKIG